MKIGANDVPVRFAMRAIALYFERKGKTLTNLSDLQFSELQDLYWIAVCEGCRREEKDNPFTEQSFFDALDDYPEVMQSMGEEMANSFSQINGDEKNQPAPKKRPHGTK